MFSKTKLTTKDTKYPRRLDPDFLLESQRFGSGRDHSYQRRLMFSKTKLTTKDTMYPRRLCSRLFFTIHAGSVQEIIPISAT